MFGYIRPMQSEMKVRELEQYKACYCSLCRTLGKKYGIATKFILNYDFVFLAMLMWSPNEKCRYETYKCPIHPIKGKCMCSSSETIDRCAGYSVILTYWKLCDSAADDGFFKAFIARAAALSIRRAYKKATQEYPEFETAVRTGLLELSKLEKQNEPSMDKMADKFAQILCAAACSEQESDQRIKKQILYHMGRWIYILDAANDIAEDKKSGNYNPVAIRYGLNDGVLTENAKKSIQMTLEHSENMITSAYELLPRNHWTDITRNILYLGMPCKCESVFEENKRDTG